MLSKVLGNGNLPPSNALISAHAPAAATAAVITLTAVADKRHVVTRVFWSYSAAPTGGKLTITGEGTTFDIDITAAGPGAFAIAYVGAVNTNVVITLASGGGAVVGKINAEHYVEQ